MNIQVVILAAGKGKRMHSVLPKVLHPLGGKPLLTHVVETALKVSPYQSPIVINGHQGELLKEALSGYPIKWVAQTAQLGTGHALLQALPYIPNDHHVLILYGDVPLIRAETLQHLIRTTPAEAFGMLVDDLSNPTGYGRIKRDYDQRIVGVIEERDADIHEKKITEINPGIYWVEAKHLQSWLPQLTDHNQQKEFYLTDIIAYAVRDGISIHAIKPERHEEIMGVNDLVQLATLERCYQYWQAEKFMHQGVIFCDPHRFDLRGELQVGQSVIIDVNVLMEGHVVIGDGCVIGPNVYLCNTTLGKHVKIKANSILDGAIVGDKTTVGPFARLRPGSVLAEEVRIGNFVEVKNSEINKHTKINHLSYIGDSEIGMHVNMGAGTITCNYDGVNKHKTIIGNDVFIGSDTQLVAPVTIGDNATIAAGSTIVKDVAANELTLTHQLNQRTRKEWQRPKKAK